MKSSLSTTGTSELLEEISPYVPDQFINEQWPLGPTGGRRRCFSAAQLWRVHLLLLVTPARSANLLVKLLQEQRGWRRFARLSHRERVPDVRMLHNFRTEVGVSGLRRVNEQLARPLIKDVADRADTIAIIDATDLPAACHAFKKRAAATVLRTLPRAGAQSSPDKASGMSGTRNTPCDFGSCIISRRFC